MTKAKRAVSVVEFREQAHRLASDLYRDCAPLDFRLIYQCLDPKPARQIAAEMHLELSSVQKLLKTLVDRQLIRVVGETKGKTRMVYVYQGVDPKEFAQKRAAQIDAANPFRLTPAQIAEGRALHSREVL